MDFISIYAEFEHLNYIFFIGIYQGSPRKQNSPSLGVQANYLRQPGTKNYESFSLNIEISIDVQNPFNSLETNYTLGVKRHRVETE